MSTTVKIILGALAGAGLIGGGVYFAKSRAEKAPSPTVSPTDLTLPKMAQGGIGSAPQSIATHDNANGGAAQGINLFGVNISQGQLQTGVDTLFGLANAFNNSSKTA